MEEIEREVEILEISLDEEEIDELVEKLNELKQTKSNFSFDIDEENELLIHYDEEDEDEEDNKEIGEEK